MSAKTDETYESSDKHLKKTIGLIALIGLAVSIQVGSGWLLATLAAVAHAGPGAILAWVIGAIFFGVIGISWIELGTMLPRSGGGVRYPRMTHGAFLSWLNAWGYLIAVISAPVIETQAVITYVGGHWPWLGFLKQQNGGPVTLTWPRGIVVGWGFLLVFLAVNIFGAKLLAESTKVVTIWKIVVPTTTFVLMFTAFHSENFTAYGGFAPYGIGAIFAAVSGGGIVFAYAGIRQIVDFGGEVIKPRRNIPLAMLIGGLLIPLVLYLCLQIGFIGAINWTAAGVTPGDYAGLLSSRWASQPLLSATEAAGFTWFSYILLSDAVLSPSATGWVWLGLGGRTLYSMSLNKEIPAAAQRMSRYGMPWVALVVATAVGFLFFLPLPSWYTFVGLVTTAVVLNYLMAGPAMAVFRRVAPELPRPIRVPGGAFWGVAGYLCALLLVYWAGWLTMVNIMSVVVLGLPVYASYASVRAGWSRNPVSGALSAVFAIVWVLVAVKSGWMFAASQDVRHWPIGLFAPVYIGLPAAFVAALWAISTDDGRQRIQSGLWVLAALIGATFLAYFGGSGPQPELRYGTDLIAVMALGVITYVWAVRTGHRTWEMDQVIQNTLADTERQQVPDPAERPGA